MTDTFQSNGLCFDNCKAKYAFAVVQGSRCWCSDYVPASSTTGCDETCPGYGQESCGNTKKGLYGYISLPNAPKGTAGGSSSTVRESDSLTPSTPLNFSPSPSPISTVIVEKILTHYCCYYTAPPFYTQGWGRARECGCGCCCRA